MIIRNNSQEKPLVFFPKLAEKIGINEAILLQQISQRIQDAKVFIADKTQHADFYKFLADRIWVHFPYPNLKDIAPWLSASSIIKITHRLRKKGLLLTIDLDWHSIDWKALDNPPY